MNNRRIITTPVGHSMVIDLLPGADAIRLSREDTRQPNSVILDERGARILAAFMASSLVFDMSSRPPEEVEDASGTVITYHAEPAPLVRVQQGKSALDIHAPGWEALRCEIELVIPRLHGTPDVPQSRH